METELSEKRVFHGKDWIELDNAAKLFPAIISDDLTSVFRLTAGLKEPVNYDLIRKAVEITSKRFPYFNVSLGSGIFWHFLGLHSNLPRIHPEGPVPCIAFAVKRKNEPLYRILVRGNRISVEFIHILTDGAGALEFLKSLLFTYLTLSGRKTGTGEGLILPDTPVCNEEFEDAYNRYFKPLPSPEKLEKSWHLPFGTSKNTVPKIIRAEIRTDEILEVSRKYKATLTEYLTSVYFNALQEIFNSVKQNKRLVRNKILRIEIPVNLRKIFPSKTMRNFSLFVMPELDMRLGNYSFEEIIRSVQYQIRQNTEEKQISRFLSSNVSYEKYFIVRILPLFIKRMAIASIYRGIASKRLTGIITNPGRVALPKEIEDMVDYFEMIPTPPNRKLKVSCGVISFRNTLRICFFNITESALLERLIFRQLAGEGIHVKILKDL